MDIIKTGCYKGTRILLGNQKRKMIDWMIERVRSEGFEEISIPIIQPESVFTNKVGEENNNLMFKFADRKGRAVCLAPEYTAVIQQLTKQDFQGKFYKLFYVQECFRGERQQRGRWRQFTQFGVEVLNPANPAKTLTELQSLARSLCMEFVTPIVTTTSVKRGLDYYENGQGFEIHSYGTTLTDAGLQLCGGGIYKGGVGFAIGIDRLLLY